MWLRWDLKEMKFEAQVQVAIDLLDEFLRTKKPFDLTMSKFFKNNRWVGKNDRREIAEMMGDIFRNFELLKFLNQKITNDHARFFVLTYLKVQKHLSEQEIEKIFCGSKYAPPKLTNFERNFLEQADLPQDSNKLPLHSRLNFPEWLTPYFQKAFGENFEQEVAALNQKASVDLRVNVLKSSIEDVEKLLRADGLHFQRSQYLSNCIKLAPGERISRGHEIIRNGLAEIQDEGSQMVAEICGAKAGDVVVDFCAGAGGKTLALASKMQNKGRIFALDKYPQRLETAQLRLRRARVHNAFCQEIFPKWLKRHANFADVVLVDAPCSGTGTWRRNTDMRARFTAKDLQELIEIQQQILQQAANLVKPGGRLIYATCSILKEEDEEQIEKFLQSSANFQLKKISVPKINEHKSAPQNHENNFLRLSPYLYGTDGFFAAILINLK